MFPARSISCSPISWRALARLWMLGVLLPFLLLSVAGNVPHEHELRALSALVHHGSGAQMVRTSSLQRNTVQAHAQNGVLFAAPIAVHPDEALCLLCHWASVVGALLVVALAISWFLTRVAVRPLVRSSRVCFAPLALRSRAPPV